MQMVTILRWQNLKSIVGNGVKLMDFGAARDVSAVAKKSLSVMLKPGYAPEEQYRSKGEQGPWTDVYALCATIYKCITGITPDDSTQRVYSDEVKTPSALGISIDPTIEAAIMKGLSVLQKDRYQSIPELINGFKGLNSRVSSEDKTVYSGRAVSEDDIATRYMSSDTEVSQIDKEEKIVTEEKPVIKQPIEERKQEVKGKQLEGEIIKPEVNIYSGKKPSVENKVKKNKTPKKKNKVVIILLACALVAGIVLIGGCFGAVGCLSLCGSGNLATDKDDISKNDTSIYLYDETITSEDMKEILKCKKLERLSFSNCTFEGAAFSYIDEIEAPLTSLVVKKCTGIENWGPVAGLKNLETLEIIGCDLDNSQLQEISFENLKKIKIVKLSENTALSDISKLTEASETLKEIYVSKTSVVDFSSLSECSKLNKIEANGNGIKDLNTITNSSLSYLVVNNNEITDISAVKKLTNLYSFEAKNNKIADISSLTDKENLAYLYLNNNLITDITSLGTCKNLSNVQLNDNQITSLSPLTTASPYLREIHVNRNKLTSLTGLENLLNLDHIEASDNELTDIAGLVNATLLKYVNLNQNEISDISILSKSAKNLVYVYFNNNNVSDLSPLKDATSITHLSFDYNEVTSLEAISNMKELRSISAEGNKIANLKGLDTSHSDLVYVYLAHNEIEDTSAVATLMVNNSSEGFIVIDLSSNKIKDLSLAGVNDVDYFAIYDNPIESNNQLMKVKGMYILLNYLESINYEELGGNFLQYYIYDCPADKQVQVGSDITGYTNYVPNTGWVKYVGMDELDSIIRNTRTDWVTGEENYIDRISNFIPEDSLTDLDEMTDEKLEEIAEKKDNLMVDLINAFNESGINVTVNMETGELAMNSSVLFGGDSSVLTDTGKNFLNKFVAAYTSIVFSEKYDGFISKTMVEGHCAPVKGDTYEDALPLSEKRANNVKDYCMSKETGVDVTKLAESLEAVGYSNSKPVLDANGEVDMAASRRVSFKFIINLE